jgi:hypothetical protein
MNPPSRTLRLGLAFIAGLGLTLMIVVAGIGVVIGESAQGASMGLIFAAGVAMLATGIIAWFAVVRPDTHFDDINQPMYHGHHDDH